MEQMTMAVKSKLIERVPDLRSQVYERLRESITSGQFGPEVRFAEQSVADDYGVSRTPAREALAMLVRDGLLVQEDRGFSLPNYTVDDIFDVFEVRLCLEPQAMRRLGQAMTGKQLRIVKEMLESDMAEDVAASDYPEVHRNVRRVLFDMSGNSRLRQAIKLYEDHVEFVRQRTLVEGDWQAVSRERMRALLNALVAGDGDEAAVAMTRVLIAARDAIVATIKRDAS
jgi:DNA-binding GntR family transcriptional regulator